MRKKESFFASLLSEGSSVLVMSYIKSHELSLTEMKQVLKSTHRDEFLKLLGEKPKVSAVKSVKASSVDCKEVSANSGSATPTEVKMPEIYFERIDKTKLYAQDNSFGKGVIVDLAFVLTELNASGIYLVGQLVVKGKEMLERVAGKTRVATFLTQLNRLHGVKVGHPNKEIAPYLEAAVAEVRKAECAEREKKARQRELEEMERCKSMLPVQPIGEVPFFSRNGEYKKLKRGEKSLLTRLKNFIVREVGCKNLKEFAASFAKDDMLKYMKSCKGIGDSVASIELLDRCLKPFGWSYDSLHALAH